MPVDATPPAVTDAYGIFMRARAAITSARYPDRIDYTIGISSVVGASARANHYRASFRAADAAIAVSPISREEAAQPPPVPHGFNFAFSASVCGGRCETGMDNVFVPAGKSAVSPDVLGVPILSPAYTFGLPFERHASVERAPAADSALPVIAVVSTQQREYTVALIDRPALDGVPTYHLQLTPLREPKTHRLRELWIGQGDYLPRKAYVAGNFTVAPLVDVPWTIDYAIVGGAPLITRETAGATLYLSHRRVVKDAVIDFDYLAAGAGGLFGRPLVQPAANDDTLTEPPR